MNTSVINKEFRKMISKRGIHHKLGLTSNYVKQLRYKHYHHIGISTDLKLRLLQKSGWRQDKSTYNRADMLSLLKFYRNSSQAAKNLGIEYILEKWEKKK